MKITPLKFEGGKVDGYINSRLMAAYDVDGHTIAVEMVHVAPDGRVTWHYILECDGEIIFNDSDLRTTMGGFAEAAHAALAFLTLRPGDVEADYFEHYTGAQLAWRDEHAESLSLFAIAPES